MSTDDDGVPASRQTARAALVNIRRMLAGEVPFPTSPEAAAEMVKAAVPVQAPQQDEPPFLGLRSSRGRFRRSCAENT